VSLHFFPDRAIAFFVLEEEEDTSLHSKPSRGIINDYMSNSCDLEQILALHQR
jgi:hypothetical protein